MLGRSSWEDAEGGLLVLAHEFINSIEPAKKSKIRGINLNIIKIPIFIYRIRVEISNDNSKIRNRIIKIMGIIQLLLCEKNPSNLLNQFTRKKS